MISKNFIRAEVGRGRGIVLGGVLIRHHRVLAFNTRTPRKSRSRNCVLVPRINCADFYNLQITSHLVKETPVSMVLPAMQAQVDRLHAPAKSDSLEIPALFLVNYFFYIAGIMSRFNRSMLKAT